MKKLINEKFTCDEDKLQERKKGRGYFLNHRGVLKNLWAGTQQSLEPENHRFHVGPRRAELIATPPSF